MWWLTLLLPFISYQCLPFPSFWGSGKDDWCEAYEVLWTSWEKYMVLSLSSSSQNAWKCFHALLRARIDPLFALDSQPMLIFAHAADLPSSFLKGLRKERWKSPHEARPWEKWSTESSGLCVSAHAQFYFSMIPGLFSQGQIMKKPPADTKSIFLWF